MTTANTGPRVAIVAAVFNPAIVEPMIAEASTAIVLAGGVVVKTLTVPGAFEIPLIAQMCLAQADVDGVVALGHIEKGETLHGEVMAHAVFESLVRLQLDNGKPMGIGIIGPGATPAQAEVRKLSAAKAAVAALMCNWKLVNAG
jgi:6,7-dimethyl-8-ribityllumazine synthase